MQQLRECARVVFYAQHFNIQTELAFDCTYRFPIPDFDENKSEKHSLIVSLSVSFDWRMLYIIGLKLCRCLLFSVG